MAVVGDSLSDPRSGGGRYVDYLRERCPGSRFDSYARGGTMVNQMRQRFDADLFAPGRPRYTHVVVFGGVNDIGSNRSARRTLALIEQDLGTMYESARSRGARVVAVTVSPWAGFRAFHTPQRQKMTEALNTWIRQGTADGRVHHVVDAYALLSCGVPDRLCDDYVAPFDDGLHFNARGHRKLGAAMYEQIFGECR